MALNKYDAPASGVLTTTIWNNQMNNIGSEFEVSYNIKPGSNTYVYDSNNNLVSGNDFSTTSSVYEWFEYDSSGDLISGHQLRDGKQTNYRYTYSDGYVVNEYRRVV